MYSCIHVALGCDDFFAPHAGVVIQSVIDSAGYDDRFVFHVVAFHLSQVSRDRLSTIVANGKHIINFHNLSSFQLDSLPAGHLTHNAYLRVFLPEVLDDLARVIYLDCDVLVLGSLRPLWEFDLRAGAIAAACEDIYSIYARMGDRENCDFFESLGIPASRGYFNSGVLLMDLAAWRERSITAKACQWGAANYDLIRYADQDVLNVILGDRVHFIPLKWNLSIHMVDRVLMGSRFTAEELDAYRSPVIIHFVGKNKGDSMVTPLPFQRNYLDCLARTPWCHDFIPRQGIDQKFKRFVGLLRRGYLKCRAVLNELAGKRELPLGGVVRIDGTDRPSGGSGLGS